MYFHRTALSVALMLLLAPLSPSTLAEEIDEDQLGAWYMYFWSTRFADSQWGLQGDTQYRNWDLGGDMEQLLLRDYEAQIGEQTSAVKAGEAREALQAAEQRVAALKERVPLTVRERAVAGGTLAASWVA